MILFYCTTDQLRVLSICVIFCWSYAPFGMKNAKNTQFSALFSYTLWHIELIFCISLCFTLLQIKIECCHLPSNFVGVMPLLELRILEIHFSLTCFDISGWNFTYDFVLLYYRSSESVVNFRQFLIELYPLLEIYWKYPVFCTFLLCALTYWAETLHITLFNVQKIKFECHNSVSVWLSVRPSIFCIFLLHTSTYLDEN